MVPEIKIAPSILSANFLSLGEDLKRAEDGGANYLHFDVMDGKFVPEISFGETVLRAVKKGCSLPTDVHLMVQDPFDNIESFAQAGADIMTVHTEACPDVNRVLNRIRSFGVKTGLSIRPDTPVEALYPFLGEVDMFLIMTVYPGFGGQKFIPSSLKRIEMLRKKLDENGLNTDIEVDGGINASTILDAYHAGANVFVAGSAVFKNDIEKNIRELASILAS